MRIDGRCHCGAVAFEAEIDEGQTFLCHCEDCQIFSGAPFRVRILASPDRFRVTRGSPRRYVKTAESGARRAMHFCEACGTQLYGTDEHDASLPVSISGGAVRQKARLVPVAQAWCRSRLPWLARLDEIQTLDRQVYDGGDPRGRPDYRPARERGDSTC
ncbi:MAG: GFA family protein [Spirochaetaceae bacterium]|nr:GFA family protein [Myxococcales bacterium]MCB9723216.1 GFA family protein [Spirochaetaceae bacterium]HPG26634.1 GFA family protein [Myxococcota bacterium]